MGFFASIGVDAMGIDIRHNKDRKVVRKTPRSTDIYIKLLVKLYRFLARRTDSGFNKVVLKRLYMSRTNRPPVSISRLFKNMNKEDRKDKTAVVVGTITDDKRFLKAFPKMSVRALHVTEGARARILAAGGTILTSDQLQVYLAVPPNHTSGLRDANSNELADVVKLFFSKIVTNKYFENVKK